MIQIPKELEITEAQRQPGLENPLTKEQVEWLNQEVIAGLAGTMLGWDNPQVIARKLLPQGKSLIDILLAIEVS
jgi:hypothetical protein